MSSLTARLREVARETGWVRALWIAPRWALRSRYEVWVFEHGPERSYPPPFARDDLRLRRIGRDDVEGALAMNPITSRAEIERRLADGQEGRLVASGDELVYVRWDAFADHYLPFLGCVFRLLPGDHHPGAAYTVAGWRGRGVHGALLAWAMHEARARGCRRSLGLVASWNQPARRAVVAAGWRGPVGTIGSAVAWPPGRRRFVATGAVRLAEGGFHVAAGEA